MYHRAKRKRDEDNAVAMLKSTYDGIVEAGVVADDNKQCMQRDWPVMRIDKQAPRMEIVITKQEMQDEG